MITKSATQQTPQVGQASPASVMLLDRPAVGDSTQANPRKNQRTTANSEKPNVFRNSRLRTFPVAFLGSSTTDSTLRGHL